MDINKILNISFEARRDVVYEISEIGYLIDNDDSLSYSTFLQRTSHVSSVLNNTAKIILLSIDGEKTLSELLDSCFEIFEGVTKEQFMMDFMEVINRLERQGIIYSKVEQERFIKIQEHRKKAFKENLMNLKSRYPYYS